MNAADLRQLSVAIYAQRDRPPLHQARRRGRRRRTITGAVRRDRLRDIRLPCVAPDVRNSHTGSEITAHLEPARMRASDVREDAYRRGSDSRMQFAIPHRLVDVNPHAGPLQLPAQLQRRSHIVHVDVQRHTLSQSNIELGVRDHVAAKRLQENGRAATPWRRYPACDPGMRHDGDVVRAKPRAEGIGRALSQREHRIRGAKQDAQPCVVLGLIHEVGVVDVVNGQHQGHRQRRHHAPNLLRAEVLEAEVDVHEIGGGARVELAPVFGGKGGVRPPMPVNVWVGSVDDTVRTHCLRIRVPGRDGEDIHGAFVGIHPINIIFFASIRSPGGSMSTMPAMPTLTVVGNCQAESIRRLLMSTGEFSSQRIKPVHELETADMGWFAELLSRTDVLVAQPIRDNYRGLPVGTSQLFATLPPGARHVVAPVLRFDGLMPYQAIIRNPTDTSENPPLVAYHDLRILAAAARGLHAPVAVVPPADAFIRGAAMSVEQIRTRERAHGTVVISDYLETNPLWHTVNHPDNETLAVLSSRILDHLDIATPPSLPDYEMLGQLDAPVDASAAAALGVKVAGRTEWRDRENGAIDSRAIAEAQLEHYRTRPELVEHGLARHAERLANLGLIP